MSDSERIAALEAKVMAMETEYRQAVCLMQSLGGSSRVFQAATLTLVAGFPHKEAFEKLFLQVSERTVASALNAQSEAHLEAVQEGQKLVLDHLHMR